MFLFLCGSPKTIDDVVAMLAREGYVENTKQQPGQLHAERCW